MLATITQISLLLTTLLCVAIAVVTLRSPVAGRRVIRIWVAFNGFVGLWAFCWWAGAFYFSDPHWRWGLMYAANASAIVLPPLFVAFVKAYLNHPIHSSRLVIFSSVFSGMLLVLALIRPADFIPHLQRVGVAYIPVAGYLLWVFAVQYAVLILIGVAVLIKALKYQTVAQRNKTLYILIGCFVGFLGGFTTFPPSLGIVKQYPYGVILVPIYCLLITHAILRHRLMDISVIIRKTMVYSMVMVPLAIVYIALVALFTRLFEGLSGYQTVFTSAVAAGLITFCFQPLKKRVQMFVDRKFFRQYVDREEKLYELSREVITHTTPEAMGGALMHVLEETLHPKGGALFLRAREGSGFVRVSSMGSAALPDQMEEDNELAKYFKDHPQPFVQDLSDELGKSRSTRLKDEREDAA